MRTRGLSHIPDGQRILGSEYGTCEFETGPPFSRQWKDLPEDDYYLVIWTNNLIPIAALRAMSKPRNTRA